MPLYINGKLNNFSDLKNTATDISVANTPTIKSLSQLHEIHKKEEIKDDGIKINVFKKETVEKIEEKHEVKEREIRRPQMIPRTKNKQSSSQKISDGYTIIVNGKNKQIGRKSQYLLDHMILDDE